MTVSFGNSIAFWVDLVGGGDTTLISSTKYQFSNYYDFQKKDYNLYSEISILRKLNLIK